MADLRIAGYMALSMCTFQPRPAASGINKANDEREKRGKNNVPEHTHGPALPERFILYDGRDGSVPFISPFSFRVCPIRSRHLVVVVFVTRPRRGAGPSAGLIDVAQSRLDD